MADCGKGDDGKVLHKELAFFESQRQVLLAAHEGKFALIKGCELAGIYASEAEAYAAGLEKFGNEPFLIKRVQRQDPTGQIPALHFGLIRADT
jgi:hypothetical protein